MPGREGGHPRGQAGQAVREPPEQQARHDRDHEENHQGGPAGGRGVETTALLGPAAEITMKMTIATAMAAAENQPSSGVRWGGGGGGGGASGRAGRAGWRWRRAV